MAKKKIPSYRLHKASGQAVVTLAGKDHYLGVHGSPESHAEYDRVIAEWLSGKQAPLVEQGVRLTVNEVVVQWLAHAEERYSGGHLWRIRKVMGIVSRLYGTEPVSTFRGRALLAIRAVLLKDDGNRRTLNLLVNLVQQAWTWLLAHELVPADAAQSVLAVKGIRQGEQKELPEHEDVPPVAREVVLATLPFLSATLRDVVRLQLATGMRPGEVLALRACEIDRQEKVWTWEPAKHKTAHHGHQKKVFLVGEAIDLARPYLEEALADTSQQDYLFSPRRNRAERSARACKPSRARKNPRRAPGERYCRQSYARAVWRATKKAGVEHWHPHQIRHTVATEFERKYGIEITRILLGHTTVEMTKRYVEVDFAKALAALLGQG